MSRGRDIFAVVMAGGSGTRFWPLSRKTRPKQFLPIISRKTMIEETVGRLRSVLPEDSIFTISDDHQAKAIRKLVPELPARNALVEPMAKNTAASLMLATARVSCLNPQAVVFALPADHLIREADKFRKKLKAAAEAAASRDVIVTFGIPPTYPATAFGYIHYSCRNGEKFQDEIFYPVLRFKEKPRPAQAKAFLKQGRHCWNSGMFVWRADVFAQKLDRHAPGFFPYWQRIVQALKKKDNAEIASVFREIPATSIDYALMEKAEGVLMGRGDFGWSDVGSWSSLLEIWPKDKAGNAFRGDTVLIDSRDCLIDSPRRLTALVGLKDVIVIDTDDALLVCHRSSDQKVKDILSWLQKKGRKKQL